MFIGFRSLQLFNLVFILLTFTMINLHLIISVIKYEHFCGYLFFILIFTVCSTHFASRVHFVSRVHFSNFISKVPSSNAFSRVHFNKVASMLMIIIFKIVTEKFAFIDTHQ